MAILNPDGTTADVALDEPGSSGVISYSTQGLPGYGYVQRDAEGNPKEYVQRSSYTPGTGVNYVAPRLDNSIQAGPSASELYAAYRSQNPLIPGNPSLSGSTAATDEVMLNAADVYNLSPAARTMLGITGDVAPGSSSTNYTIDPDMYAKAVKKNLIDPSKYVFYNNQLLEKYTPEEGAEPVQGTDYLYKTSLADYGYFSPKTLKTLKTTEEDLDTQYKLFSKALDKGYLDPTRYVFYGDRLYELPYSAPATEEPAEAAPAVGFADGGTVSALSSRLPQLGKAIRILEQANNVNKNPDSNPMMQRVLEQGPSSPLYRLAEAQQRLAQASNPPAPPSTGLPALADGTSEFLKRVKFGL